MESHPAVPLYNLCEDILLMICDHLLLTRSEEETPITNLSLTSHHLRHLLVPHLFKNIHINRPLKQLASTSLVYHYAQTLRVDMFGSMWWWCSGAYVSSVDALTLFQFIQKLSYLRTLNVTMMKRNLDMFDTAFTEGTDLSPFTLPQIESLTVTSAAAFLPSHCPNLRTLTIEDTPTCMLEAYVDIETRLRPRHPQLSDVIYTHVTHFEASATWSEAELCTLVSLFPRLRYLRMCNEAFCYRASVPRIAAVLGQLEDLRTLRLVKIGCLDMGYRAVWKRSIQSCANERQRRVLWMQNEARRVEAENEVARLAFGLIGSLRECWLGEKRVAWRLESENGRAKWLWKRMKEDAEGCFQGAEWAGFRSEKDAVVLSNEVCM